MASKVCYAVALNLTNKADRPSLIAALKFARFAGADDNIVEHLTDGITVNLDLFLGSDSGARNKVQHHIVTSAMEKAFKSLNKPEYITFMAELNQDVVVPTSANFFLSLDPFSGEPFSAGSINHGWIYRLP